ncbi:helix-turn-helix domain-containing protein [Kitasatospora sp. NPDC001175]|uniref:helix-turn-helix domain-containing protein n=1 Tax=Kitasatospora sp. NPDC001175 TaxID=3157103 RepID=UPI003CFC1F90
MHNEQGAQASEHGKRDERSGPADAHANLVRRLRHALACAGLTKTQLAARADLGRTTVQLAFTVAASVPSDTTVATLAKALGLPHQERQELLDLCHAAAQKRPPAEQGRFPAGSGTPLREGTALPDKPKPVGSWEAKSLEVHPAIRGDSAAAPGEDFVLPTYVERNHDQELRVRLEAAADGEQAVMVMVRGWSCTGKTRTAFEGVRTCLGNWQLVFPKDTASLLALLAADALTERTVLWLNEAQNYLTGPSGEAAAAALRRRLEEPGPVVILATLWPDHHTRLTSAAGGPQARALLDPLIPIDVPAAFDEQDLKRLRRIGHPSLDAADRRSSNGAITQTLAAGPQLVDHYEQASGPEGPLGKAVITAAMDACRLGHASPLPAELLKAAAPGYLTPEQRAAADPELWFDQALTFAQKKIKGVVAALGPVAHPTGMGPVPGVFRLADYLDHHAYVSRRDDFPSALFWSAVEQHAATPADHKSLAKAARERGRYRIAHDLLRRAVARGDTDAFGDLVTLRMKAGDGVGVEAVAREAVDLAGVDNLLQLAVKRDTIGDDEAAETLYRAAAQEGDSSALMILAGIQEEACDWAGAEESYREAARRGHRGAALGLGGLCERVGDWMAAEALYRETVEQGDPYYSLHALRLLGRLREQADDWTGAEGAYREAADKGNAGGLIDLAGLRERAGDRAGAEALYREAAARGETSAFSDLAALRERAGDRLGAEDVCREAAARGRADVFSDLAELREKNGDRAGAEALYREAAQRDTGALIGLARLRERAGDRPGAEAVYREAADRGDLGALIRLAMREELDRTWVGTQELVCRGRITGDWTAAEAECLMLVNSGGGLGPLVLLRRNAGAPEEALQLSRYGLEADGSAAEPW